ncbi:UDP-glucose 4-epimerase GalE [Flavisphingomonas formosensis]|uniref:UDP-glucose 4-epimerase GalE n=1 Tax=Flavisphingomonas formosensis TaxID=861534 RepID=UPI0012F8D8F8|nr:UDP-glucose 4-epimerase GalE [Sphingomonas formosensis]
MATNAAKRNRTPVLVTGGAGYIGSHACLALVDAGWPLVVLDNLSTGFRWAVPPQATFIQGDVGDAALVARVLRDHGIGAIMHFAGSVIVPESVANPLKYYRNNTANSASLVAEAISAGVPHFIFSSTAAIYGVPEEMPVTESTPPMPINPYGRSKLMTEHMLRDVASAHPINYCALRYFNVAGADRAGRTGQSTLGATHLIKVAVEAALGKRDHVAVFGTDYPTRDGTGVRDFIHVSDLVSAHIDALEALIAAPERSYVLNCGYGQGFTVLDVLESVERVAGVRITRRLEPRRMGDSAEMIADNSAIIAQLPWRPRFAELDAMVADAINWERGLADLLAHHGTAGR